MTDKQVRSKQRVVNFSEVLTGEHEIKAMCDLVKQETERIERRFLAPACGNGNFLAEVLSRKLAVVKIRYGKSSADYEKYSVLAVTSIYGVELCYRTTPPSAAPGSSPCGTKPTPPITSVEPTPSDERPYILFWNRISFAVTR